MAETVTPPPQVRAEVLAQELDLAELTPLPDMLLLVAEQARIVDVATANAHHRAESDRRRPGRDRSTDQEPVVAMAPEPHDVTVPIYGPPAGGKTGATATQNKREARALR